MPKLHFVNGFILDVPEDEYRNLIKRVQHVNIKFWIKKSTEDLVFMNSPSMALLERELPDDTDGKNEISEGVSDESESEETVVEDVETSEPEKKEDPAIVALREMTAKSNCHKNKHEGQNQIIYRQNIRTKNGQSERFFPVCEFCGFKGRFIAATKLNDTIKEAAILWKE